MLWLVCYGLFPVRMLSFYLIQGDPGSATDAIAFWGKDAAGDRAFDLHPAEKIIKVIGSQ